MHLSSQASSGLAGRTVIFLIALVGALALLAGALTYRSYRDQVRQDIGAQLEAVAELKARELAQWRQERSADARFFSQNRAFADLARRALHDGDTEAAAEVLEWFDRMRAVDRYARIILVDLDGAARLAQPPETSASETRQATASDQSHRSGEVAWVDFHRGQPGDAVRIDLLAPITGADGAPLATVSLGIDPRAYLYPFIQRWPVPARSAETFIVRRDGDHVLYLNPLRFDTSVPLTVRVPLSRTEVPAVRGALGAYGLLEGADYQNTPVVAAVRPVPSSPWVLVARMDPEEAWAPIRARLWQTIIIGLLAIVAAGGGLTSLWQRSRATADAALRESERRYRQLFEANPHPMWVYDVETLRFLAVNDAAVAHYGWSREQFLGMTIADIRPEEDVPRLREDIARAPDGIDDTGLWRHYKADGSLIDVEIVSHVLEFGGREGVLVLAHDVTARLRAERELRQLNEDFSRAHGEGAVALARLKALVEASPTVLYMLAADEPDYPATWVSDNVARILGYSVEEALTPGWFGAHLHPDDRDRVRAENAALGTRETLVHEYRFRDARGRYRAIRDELRFATTGGRPSLVGAWTDVTEQRESAARQRLQLTVLETAANAIVITSANGVIEWANPAFAELTGYSLAEAIGHTPGALLRSGRHDAAFYRAMWDTVKAGGVWHGELVNKRKDGTLYDEEMTITPVRDEKGEIAHFVAIKQGIGERKHLQEQFLQAQRMESVGRLAGGVAHDFNNLLTVINSYAELAIDDLPVEHPLRPSIIEIHKAGERAAGLTRQLLAFSRKQVLQPQQIDLNLIVANMEKMLRRLLGEDVELVVVSDDSSTVVRADPGQIEQVLMNLAVNARDAMPRGGTLTIETRRRIMDDALAAEHPGLIPGSWITMTVTDTGTGMSAETRERAFEPFFTTKALGQGTGLGLPTVFGIVQQSGGLIWVDSTLGQGTSFTICLPDIGAASPAGSSHAAPAMARGTETILIVEDDDMLRDLTKHVLSVSGYQALTAASGDNALLLLEQLETPVHLLLTDVVMPGMTGRELAERVRTRWPGTKVLFMSGYTDDAIVRHGVLDGRTRLLNKPFTRAQVLSIVRDVLDET